MKGALRFVWLLFTSFRLQRWLNGVALLALPAAFILPREAAPGLVIWGAAFILLSPTFAAGFLMRSVSARRALWLVPSGREQILLGALISTLLVAGVITFCAWALRFPEFPGFMRISLAELFWRIEAAATLTLLGGFLLSRSVLGFSLWWTLQAVLLTRLSQQGLWSVLGPLPLGALTVLVWALFAALYLRVPVTARPFASIREAGLTGTVLRLAPSPAVAVSALLTEQPRDTVRLATGFFVVAILCGVALSFPWLSGGGERSWPQLLGQVFPLVLTYVVGTTFENLLIAARARRLWLHGGFDRKELFRVCERVVWRNVAISFVPIAVLVTVCWAFAPQDLALNMRWLVVNAVFTPLALYFCLTMTRGWRWPDVLLGLPLLAAWVVLLLFLHHSSLNLAFIAAAATVLSLALRALAMRRWSAIDWLVCRPARGNCVTKPALG